MFVLQFKIDAKLQLFFYPAINNSHFFLKYFLI